MKNHFELLVLSGFFVTLIGAAPPIGGLPKDCGRTRFDNANIDVTTFDQPRLGQYPWTARIGMDTKTENDSYYYCGGTILTRYHIITAAQCALSSTVVRLGENNLKTETDCDPECDECAPPPQDLKIRNCTYSNACSERNDNDIAIIELEKPVEFNEYVQPICFPPKELPQEKMRRYNAATVSGWGVSYSGYSRALVRNTAPEGQLSGTDTFILQDNECAMLYNKPVDDNELCVGNGAYRSSSSCIIDTGGPLVNTVESNGKRRAFLAGVATKDSFLCETDDTLPILYTEVSYHRQWILENIDKSNKEIEARRK